MDRVPSTVIGAVTITGGGYGYHDEDLTTGKIGTDIVADYLPNPVQEEIVGAIEKSGQTPDLSDWTQLDQAIVLRSQRQPGNWAMDSGAANAYVATLTPAPTALAQLKGMPIRVLAIQATNTGPSTLNVNGLGAVAILRADGVALSGYEMTAAGSATVVYDGAHFILQSGKRVGWQVLDVTATPGVSSFTVPPGVSALRVRLCGGGGGGGVGSAGTTNAGGGGGGAGGYAESIITVTPGQSFSLTVAAGGTPAGAGGTTAFDSLLAATGGQPGGNAGLSGFGGQPGSGVTGQILLTGGWGSDGSGASLTFPGNGGASAFGGGGRAANANASEETGLAPGSGGGGTYGVPEGGGWGANGIIIVEGLYA